MGRGPVEADSGYQLVMGTFAHVVVVANDSATARKCVEAALEEIRFREGRIYNYSAVVEAMHLGGFADVEGGTGGPFNPRVPTQIATQIQTAIPNAMQAGLKWGCPYIVNWQLYCNELKDPSIKPPVKTNDAVRGFWLIRPDGTKSWVWDYFHGLLTATR